MLQISVFRKFSILYIKAEAAEEEEEDPMGIVLKREKLKNQKVNTFINPYYR
jgi:hypothetical protein